MRFFTRLTMVYALIVLVLTGAYYFLSQRYGQDSGKVQLGLFLGYIAIIFFSTIIISSRDEKNGYAGLNYHLTTYIIVNSTSLILALLSKDDNKEFLNSVIATMSIWGVGILFHWGMYYFIFRKRNIGRYEKEDVFK